VNLAVIGANPWFVEALKATLGPCARFHLLATAPDVAGFVSDPAAQRADIAILACNAAYAETPRLFSWARRHHPRLRIVLKYPGLRPDLVRDAMQAGAWGCFSAEDPPETLMTLLRSIADGRVSFPYVDFATLRDDPFEQLTRREEEVLGALARGWTNSQISARLGISENTVKYHLRLIYDKLGVANRSTAIAQYMARMQI